MTAGGGIEVELTYRYIFSHGEVQYGAIQIYTGMHAACTETGHENCTQTDSRDDPVTNTQKLIRGFVCLCS